MKNVYPTWMPVSRGGMNRARNRLLPTMGILFVIAACSGTAKSSSPTAASSTTEATTPTPAATAALAATPTLPSTPTSAHTLAAVVLGSGSYSGYTVVVPDGWHGAGDHFVVKYDPSRPGPVLGLSLWDVGRVYRDPCHYLGQDYDPGPTVDDLVKALVEQKLRDATTPTVATLDGYTGRYLEWSVPADMKSSKWTQFDACDLGTDSSRDFESWLPTGGSGDRYEQVPGQIDRLWVLDVKGQRLVIDATYSSDTSQADRAELEQIVESLRFATP